MEFRGMAAHNCTNLPPCGVSSTILKSFEKLFFTKNLIFIYRKYIEVCCLIWKAGLKILVVFTTKMFECRTPPFWNNLKNSTHVNFSPVVWNVVWNANKFCVYVLSIPLCILSYFADTVNKQRMTRIGKTCLTKSS